MHRFKHAMVALAAAGLTLAQPASAAARIGAPIDEAEAAASAVGIVAMLALLIGVVAIATGDSGEDPEEEAPTSP